jgi:hypothetical protein
VAAGRAVIVPAVVGDAVMPAIVCPSHTLSAFITYPGLSGRNAARPTKVGEVQLDLTVSNHVIVLACPHGQPSWPRGKNTQKAKS